jgi:pre-rRNA-processing protein TSR1
MDMDIKYMVSAATDYWMAVSGDEGAESGSSDEEEYEDLAVDGEQEKYDKAQEYEDEAAELKRIRAERALEDLEFPDEIDTPMDQPARVRFQKFRGLQSFRTSPWDPKENLPIDYARIFQFEDFQRTAKRVVKEARRQDAVAPGSFVTIFVRNVPLHYLGILVNAT